MHWWSRCVLALPVLHNRVAVQAPLDVIVCVCVVRALPVLHACFAMPASRVQEQAEGHAAVYHAGHAEIPGTFRDSFRDSL